MTSTVYDSVVIGAGVEGSAAAYKLAESGQRTLLLEQFELLHSNGSSHGGSRIALNSYVKQCLADLTADIFPEWAKIEQLTGKPVFVNTGFLMVGKKPSPGLKQVAEALSNRKIPHRIVNSGDELRKAMPNTTYTDDFYGIHEPGGGALLASKAVGCMQELVLKFGGEIVDRCEVVDINPGTLITLNTKDGRVFQTKNLVICAGTWAGQLLKKLGLDVPFTLKTIYVTYWKEKVVGTYTMQNGSPCFSDRTGTLIYGFPTMEYPGHVKLLIDGGYEYSLTNPDEHEGKAPYNLNVLTDYIDKHFPGLVSSEPSIVEKCKYTMTPDEVFILDKHPKHENIFFGAGFSGLGFKFAPVVGNILRDFVLRVQPKYDMDSYRWNRF